MADRFSGYYEHGLDPKGRINIPAKFKSQLGNSITFLRAEGKYGKYLKVCSLGEWETILGKYEDVDEDESPELYDKMRRMTMTSIDGNEPDSQGRLLVPQQMRAYAELEKEVVVAGAGRHVEIWERKRFHDFIEGREPEA